MHTQGRMPCFYELLRPSKKMYASRRTPSSEKLLVDCTSSTSLLSIHSHSMQCVFGGFLPFSSSAFLFALSYHCPSIPGGSQTSKLIPLPPGSKDSPKSILSKSRNPACSCDLIPAGLDLTITRTFLAAARASHHLRNIFPSLRR